jgi:hypothetical protein
LAFEFEQVTRGLALKTSEGVPGMALTDILLKLESKTKRAGFAAELNTHFL